jgi:hypothetical protein
MNEIDALIKKRDAIKSSLLARIAAGEQVTRMDCLPLRLASEAIIAAFEDATHLEAMRRLPHTIQANQRQDWDWH